MLKLIVICLICLVVTVFLRQYKPEYALLSAGASMVVIAALLFGRLSPLIGELSEMLEGYGIDDPLTVYLIKVLGICLITRLCFDLCNDFGQSALACKVELTGKAAVVLLSLPLIKEILDCGLALL